MCHFFHGSLRLGNQRINWHRKNEILPRNKKVENLEKILEKARLELTTPWLQETFHGNWNIGGAVLNVNNVSTQGFQCFPGFSLADTGAYLSVTRFHVKFDNVKALTKGTPSSRWGACHTVRSYSYTYSWFHITNSGNLWFSPLTLDHKQSILWPAVITKIETTSLGSVCLWNMTVPRKWISFYEYFLGDNRQKRYSYHLNVSIYMDRALFRVMWIILKTFWWDTETNCNKDENAWAFRSRAPSLYSPFVQKSFSYD